MPELSEKEIEQIKKDAIVAYLKSTNRGRKKISASLKKRNRAEYYKKKLKEKNASLGIFIERKAGRQKKEIL